MPETTRTATSPAKGGGRDTLLGALPAAATAYVFAQTGSPELATAAGAVATGLLTFVRKLVLDAVR